MLNIKLKSIMQFMKNQDSLCHDFFPAYVFVEQKAVLNKLFYYYYRLLLMLVKCLFRLRLGIFGSSYKRYRTVLENEEVARIYTREAKAYEWKHHLTTNYCDTWWRRRVAQEVVGYHRSSNLKSSKVHILDIATGIGLSIEEMLKIFKLFKVSVDIIGLDYNQEMLFEANNVIMPRLERLNLIDNNERTVKFVRGDARNLVGRGGRQSELVAFDMNKFDIVTIMFGIGGIDSPIEVIREALSVLKENGLLIITDMHRPILSLNEKWPWFIGRRYTDAFAILTWETATKPLALARLWGWRDPTAIFYLAPLIVGHAGGNGHYYGFEQVSLFLNNEKWWLGVPVIPTAKLVLRKNKLTESEFKRRKNLLQEILYP